MPDVAARVLPGLAGRSPGRRRRARLGESMLAEASSRSASGRRSDESLARTDEVVHGERNKRAILDLGRKRGWRSASPVRRPRDSRPPLTEVGRPTNQVRHGWCPARAYPQRTRPSHRSSAGAFRRSRSGVRARRLHAPVLGWCAPTDAPSAGRGDGCPRTRWAPRASRLVERVVLSPPRRKAKCVGARVAPSRGRSRR